MDRATATLLRPSVARICVEMNKKKAVQNTLQMNVPGVNSWTQEVVYQYKPLFCTTCKLQGHESSSCKRRRGASHSQGKESSDSRKSVKEGKITKKF